DKLCGVYINQAKGGGLEEWSRENDRSLLIGLLKHGNSRYQAMVQDDTLGLRPALELALAGGGGASWQLAWGEDGPTGQPGFKGSPEWKYVKDRLLLLERTLVDEHQYRQGKASLERELKTLLARHQKSLGPNDQRIEQLIASVKEAQEREVPELVTRLAAIEEFQAAGEKVTAMRRRQEDARKRLTEAFSAMSAYIQRYRCQESEFDLGAALMNPMADYLTASSASGGRGVGEREGLSAPFPHGGSSHRRAGLGQRGWGGLQARDGSNGEYYFSSMGSGGGGGIGGGSSGRGGRRARAGPSRDSQVGHSGEGRWSSASRTLPRGMLFNPNAETGAAGTAGGRRQQQQQHPQGPGSPEESEGEQQVRHLLRVRQAMLGGGNAGMGRVGSGGGGRSSSGSRRRANGTLVSGGGGGGPPSATRVMRSEQDLGGDRRQESWSNDRDGTALDEEGGRPAVGRGDNDYDGSGDGRGAEAGGDGEEEAGNSAGSAREIAAQEEEEEEEEEEEQDREELSIGGDGGSADEETVEASVAVAAAAADAPMNVEAAAAPPAADASAGEVDGGGSDNGNSSAGSFDGGATAAAGAAGGDGAADEDEDNGAYDFSDDEMGTRGGGAEQHAHKRPRVE
ncbi:unnamed protein product, partial [Ectocarpus sp. 6 AP-2014]